MVSRSSLGLTVSFFRSFKRDFPSGGTLILEVCLVQDLHGVVWFFTPFMPLS